jgi:hypothetical protein
MMEIAGDRPDDFWEKWRNWVLFWFGDRTVLDTSMVSVYSLGGADGERTQFVAIAVSHGIRPRKHGDIWGYHIDHKTWQTRNATSAVKLAVLAIRLT